MKEYKIITVTLNPCIDKTIEVENFKISGVNRIGKIRDDAGGKGINVSRVLSECDTPSLALGISGGENGRKLKELLEKENVCYDFADSGTETRTNYKIFDSKNKITTDINQSGEMKDDEAIDKFLNKLSLYLKNAEVLALSGSIPKGCPSDIYSKIIRLSKENDVKVILDADGELLKEGLKEKPYAVKPNKDEVERLFDIKLESKEDIINAGKKILNMGIELVIISLGEKGAAFFKEDKVIFESSVSGDVKSTVGCGDTMVGAVAYSVVKGYDLEKTARFSTHAAAISATLEGTTVYKILREEKS